MRTNFLNISGITMVNNIQMTKTISISAKYLIMSVADIIKVSLGCYYSDAIDAVWEASE
jgi:hypothetical protein